MLFPCNYLTIVLLYLFNLLKYHILKEVPTCFHQVTGELSNNGQPMRRFMQTFVLAPQSPKKYYVHNDIFRYQDEVFHDNDTDTENQEDTVGRLDYWSYSKHALQISMFKK